MSCAEWLLDVRRETDGIPDTFDNGGEAGTIAGVDMTCNAQVKAGSKLHICDLPFQHEGEHRDGEFFWTESGW